MASLRFVRARFQFFGFVLWLASIGAPFAVLAATMQEPAVKVDTTTIDSLCNQADRSYYISPGEALASAQKAARLSQQLGYTRGIIRSALALGTSVLSVGNYPKAFEHFNQARTMSRQNGYRQFEAEALHRLGNYYYRQSDYNNALKQYQQALALRQELKDTLGMERTQNNIGELLYDHKQYSQSLQYFDKIRLHREATGDSAGLAMVVCNMAKNDIALGNYGLARGQLQRAGRLAVASGNKVVDWDVHYHLGKLYQSQRLWEEALMEFTEAQRLALARGNNFMIAPTLNRLAECYLITGQSQKALEIVTEGERMAVGLGSLQLLLDTYQTLGKVYEATRSFERALHFERQANAIGDSIQSVARNLQFAELQVRYQTEQKEQQIQLLKKNEDLQKVYQTLLVIGYLLITITLILVFLRYRAHLQSEKLLKNKNDEVQLANAEITRQIRLLDDQAQELKRVGKEKDEFIGIAAHDLKNPIAAIRIFTGLLRHGTDRLSQKEILEYATKIQISADQMMEIVMNLLESNRLESGKVELHLAPTDVGPMLDQMVANYEERAVQKHIKIRAYYDDPLPVVMLDNLSMLQVLDNLVSNAVKFSPRGTTITLRATANDDVLRIEVRDQGPGILPKDFPMLFGKFARLSARPTAGESSTGLGLSIVKKLVDMMGGTVTCESEPGKGANFIVVFRLPPLEDEDDGEEAEEPMPIRYPARKV